MEYFEKLLQQEFYLKAVKGGLIANIATSAGMEDLYMRNHSNAGVVTPLRVLEWTWRHRPEIKTYNSMSMIERLEQESNATMNSLFTLADSVKSETPKVSLVARPHTPTTARQVSKSKREKSEVTKKIKEKNLREEAALHTGRLFVQMAEKSSTVKSKEPTDRESRYVTVFDAEHAEALKMQLAGRKIQIGPEEFHMHSEGTEEEVSDRYPSHSWEDNLFQTGPLKILANALADSSKPIAREVFDNIYKFSKDADTSRYEIREKEMKVIRLPAGSRTDTQNKQCNRWALDALDCACSIDPNFTIEDLLGIMPPNLTMRFKSDLLVRVRGNLQMRDILLKKVKPDELLEGRSITPLDVKIEKGSQLSFLHGAKNLVEPLASAIMLDAETQQTVRDLTTLVDRVESSNATTYNSCLVLYNAFFQWSQQYHKKEEADLGSFFEGTSEAGKSTVDDLAADSEYNSVHSTRSFEPMASSKPTPKKTPQKLEDVMDQAPTPKIRKKPKK